MLPLFNVQYMYVGTVVYTKKTPHLSIENMNRQLVRKGYNATY